MRRNAPSRRHLHPQQDALLTKESQQNACNTIASVRSTPSPYSGIIILFAHTIGLTPRRSVASVAPVRGRGGRRAARHFSSDMAKGDKVRRDNAVKRTVALATRVDREAIIVER